MKRGCVIFLSILAFCAATSAQIQPFKNGDRIAFVGNSITEAGYYESYVWLYYMLHFPGRRIVILNRGIGGDRAKNMYERFDDDVVPSGPTVICLTFGMNDSGYGDFLTDKADSMARVHLAETRHYFDLLQQKLKALPDVRKILIGGSPYDETVKLKNNYFPGKSKVMEQIVGFQQQAATDNHWGWVDLFHPMTALTLEQQRTDSLFTLTSKDRIHPGNAGHFVMAWLFLQAQGLDELPVADVAIDGGGERVGGGGLRVDRAVNCQISHLSVLNDREGVGFDYLAGSLPFPVDTVVRIGGDQRRQADGIRLVPFYTCFNREMLRVAYLEKGKYTLTIDDRLIGVWSDVELGEGVNLAMMTNTPEYEQAMQVLLLNEERMAVESRLRAYYWLQFDLLRGLGLAFKDDQAAMDSVNAAAPTDWQVSSRRDNYRAGRYPAVRADWQQQIDVLVNTIYKLDQPRTRRIVVRKIR